MGSNKMQGENPPQKSEKKKKVVVIPKAGIERKVYLKEKNIERRAKRKVVKEEAALEAYKVEVQKQKGKGPSRNTLRKTLFKKWLTTDGKWVRLIDKFAEGEALELTPVGATMVLPRRVIKKTHNRLFLDEFILIGNEYACKGVILKACYTKDGLVLKVLCSEQKRTENLTIINNWRKGQRWAERDDLGDKWRPATIKAA